MAIGAALMLGACFQSHGARLRPDYLADPQPDRSFSCAPAPPNLRVRLHRSCHRPRPMRPPWFGIEALVAPPLRSGLSAAAANAPGRRQPNARLETGPSGRACARRAGMACRARLRPSPCGAQPKSRQMPHLCSGGGKRTKSTRSGRMQIAGWCPG